MSTLFDADLATVSDLAARRRRTATIADVDADYRADLVTRYATARDWADELAILAEAARYDAANPAPLGWPSLTDELHGTALGDVA